MGPRALLQNPVQPALPCHHQSQPAALSVHVNHTSQHQGSAVRKDARHWRAPAEPSRTEHLGPCTSVRAPWAPAWSRRHVMQSMLWSAAIAQGLRWVAHPSSARAAMVFMPAVSLKNDYFLVRAGESKAEEQGFVLTNTVYKTSIESGLSKRGKTQVLKETAAALERMDACGNSCWLWPSITQRSYQTAEILGALFGLTRSRIVPEFSFLDPRGLGAYEGLNITTAMPQVHEGDLLSPSWSPPKGSDGTPSESANDLLVRMRQIMSITETQWSGSSVIIISPDSDCLSVLQAAVLGTDLRNHAQYAFQPGEARELQLAKEQPADFFKSKQFKCVDPPKCTIRQQV